MYEDVIKKLEAMPNIMKAKLYNGIEITLVAPYKCKIFFNQREYGLTGYGAFGLTKNVHSFSDGDSERLGLTIGNYCESAANCTILLGGEHKNDRVINYTFSAQTDQVALARAAGINISELTCFTRGQVTIGSNVTLSVGSVILSGLNIGNGAVIGAGAVVTKDVPPFAIVAGNPAKVIKYRFDEKTIEVLQKIRWWDMRAKLIFQHLNEINSLPDPAAIAKLKALGPEAYNKPDNNYLVFRFLRESATGKHLAFLGAEIDGKMIKLDDLPDEFKLFASQFSNPPGSYFYLIKDIFKLSGLT